jgi:hypothetical protein
LLQRGFLAETKGGEFEMLLQRGAQINFGYAAIIQQT